MGKLRAFGKFVIVRLQEDQNNERGKHGKLPPKTGTVVSVGPSVPDGPEGPEVGDDVLYPAHAGYAVNSEGEDYVVLNVDSVLCSLKQLG